MLKDLTVIEVNSKNAKDENIQKLIAQYSTAIAERVKIFKDKRINQWQDNYDKRNSLENVTNNLLQDNTKTLLICLSNDNTFVGGTLIKETERPGYWEDKQSKIKARYITGLVTDPKLKGNGAGKAVMVAIAHYGEKNKIEKFRLDCRSDNENSFLPKYYKNRGFSLVGTGYKEPATINGVHYEDYPYALFEAEPKAIILANQIKQETIDTVKV